MASILFETEHKTFQLIHVMYTGCPINFVHFYLFFIACETNKSTCTCGNSRCCESSSYSASSSHNLCADIEQGTDLLNPIEDPNLLIEMEVEKIDLLQNTPFKGKVSISLNL